jgi:hypothetical protein
VRSATFRRVVRWFVAAVLGALLCGAAVGCRSSGDDSAAGDGTGTGAASALEATLRRSRLFETRRQIGLELAAGGDADVHVGTIQLVTPLYETVPPTDRDATLTAGDGARLMPIPYGTARCDTEPEGPPELVAVIDGEEVRVPLTEHPAGMLTRLHDIECTSAVVLEDAGLELSGDWTVTDPHTASGQLTLTQRTPGVTATVDEVHDNVIFSITTANATTPILTVDDDQPSAAVGVTISASRCDAHALIEYKRTFKFAVEVRIGDDDPVPVDVEAQGDARTVLEELLRSCIG